MYALRDSYFYDVLKRMYPAERRFDLVTYENALYTVFYQHLFQTVVKRLAPKAREEINDLFVSYIDLKNLVRILRLKRSFHVSSDYILGALLPFGDIRMRTIVEMVNAGTSEDVLEIAKKSRIKKKLTDAYHIPDELPERYVYKKSLHNIRFSVYPPVVALSYFNLVNNEIANIIKIIEGIRYNIPPDNIKEMLIYSQKE